MDNDTLGIAALSVLYILFMTFAVLIGTKVKRLIISPKAIRKLVVKLEGFYRERAQLMEKVAQLMKLRGQDEFHDQVDAKPFLDTLKKCFLHRIDFLNRVPMLSGDPLQKWLEDRTNVYSRQPYDPSENWFLYSSKALSVMEWKVLNDAFDRQREVWKMRQVRAEAEQKKLEEKIIKLSDELGIPLRFERPEAAKAQPEQLPPDPREKLRDLKVRVETLADERRRLIEEANKLEEEINAELPEKAPFRKAGGIPTG